MNPLEYFKNPYNPLNIPKIPQDPLKVGFGNETSVP